ncbi:MAG: iron-containing alcohol dehydrogenase, partial [Planctomycetota bacterium]
MFGLSSVDRVGELTRELSVSRVLLVTCAGVQAAGHAARVLGSLESAGLAVTVFSSVRENPTEQDAEACVAAARTAGVDGFVGLGGGSAIDTARAAAILLKNGGRMADYEGYGKATRPVPPLVAIPTTSGTGSECQSFALIAEERSHRKMACGDPKAAARVAILDPALTVTQPRNVTACTGLDALAHAVETAVTTKRNPLSSLYSHEAFRRIEANLPRVLEAPEDLKARSHMQLAAAFAGMAIEQSMLGAAHAAANPLTARYGIVHGQAVAAMLPAVLRFNAQDRGALAIYAELARDAGLAPRDAPADVACTALLARVRTLLSLAGAPGSLAERGVLPEA